MKNGKVEKGEECRGFLRRVGLKATSQRIFILQALRSFRQPTSIQGIIAKIDGTIDRATVYRILKSFKAKGMVRQVDFQHGHAHYELQNAEDHHHLVCLLCGTSEDVPACDAEEMGKMILKKSRRFSVIEEHTLEFYGICRLCVAKDKRTVRARKNNTHLG